MLLVGLVAVAANAAVSSTAHYTFDETSPGNWEVYIDVTGDTSGLSAYEVWVDVVPGTVSYVENTLATGTTGFMPGTETPGRKQIPTRLSGTAVVVVVVTNRKAVKNYAPR